MLRLARREPSAILLAAQLSAVLVYPFLEDSDVGRAIFSLLGIGILGLVLLAYARRQRTPGSPCCSACPRRGCS